MSFWKSLGEWYLGIPPAGSGEGTQWRWQTESLWPVGWPGWFGGLLAIVIVAALLWSYRREGDFLARWQRLTLTALRLAAIAIAWWLWTQPTLVIARSGLPPLAVLFDTSASMGLEDDQSTAGKMSDHATATRRWDRLQNVLQADQRRLLHELAKDHPLRLYQFAESIAALSAGEVTTSEQVDQALNELRDLKPEGRQTRPAEAVRQLLAALRGVPPTAIILWTDGIASESDADKLSTVADLVRRRGTELLVVPVGSDRPRRDIQLHDLVMDDVAFRGDPVVIAGKLRTQGIANTSLLVRVRAEGDDKVWAETRVARKADEASARFELTITPEVAGEFDLTIEAVPEPDEADVDNNRERRRLSVREERLQVLLVESSPRYEFRYLKQWLERDPTIQLQTLLAEADPEYAREDRTGVPYFPARREDLWKYDVVILGDVAPTQLGSSAADWLSEFVRERGGGLLLIAGPKSNPSTCLGTALEALLPFPREAIAPKSHFQAGEEPYRPQLTLDGKKGVPIFRLADTEQRSEEIWNSLPGLFGVLPIRVTRPGARILAEHPHEKGEEGRLPVILMQQVGAGKVLFHASDELWRWRFRTGDQYYGRYWGQALRYLSRSRLLDGSRTVELLVERQTFHQGEPVLLRARFLDDRFVPNDPTAVRAMLDQTGVGRREVALTRLPHLPTVFETQVTGLSSGAYHAWLSRPSFDTAPPFADFRVESLQRETQRRPVDLTDLKLAVQWSGGRLVPLEEAADLSRYIPAGRLVPLEQGRPLPLWSRFEPLCLLAGLLISEWVLRRRWRLL